VREFRGDPRGAAKAYERAGTLSTSDADRAEAFKRGGYNWLGAGDLDKAYRALTAARRYGNRDPEVLAGLSAVHERRGDFAAAARFVRSALAAAQGAPEYRYRLARLYDRAHEYGNANKQYRRLLDESPPEFLSRHRTDILVSLARNYRQLEIGSEARRFYSLVLEQDPHNREAREFLSYFGW
jgi:tetratricopeptide (TPR) repeat protein